MKVLMRDNSEDKYKLLLLQEKILEIVAYIDLICQKNNIDYCLMGGSALGAARHGGFIPWDDDLDIFMTPENYEKFREVFNNQGDKSLFYLQEWGACKGRVTTSKLRMNNTTFVEECFRDWDIHQGIFVDIMILHRCPENRILRTWQYVWAKLVVVKGLQLREGSRHSGIKRIVIYAAKILPYRALLNFGLWQIYRYRNKQTKLYCHFLGKAGLIRGTYKREWFENNDYSDFEKTRLKTPGKLHEYLFERWGDYMKMPSEEQIKYDQHASKWDTEIGFEKYCPNINSYADEQKLC